MAPKPGTRRKAKPSVIRSYTDEELRERMKENAAQSMLTVTGFPKALWHSIQFTSGVRKQAELLKQRIRDQAGGDELEMERLERQLDLTEEELDAEAAHFGELTERLSPAQQTKLAETLKQIRAMEDVRDTLQAEEQRRIDLGEWEDNTPPGSPRDGAFDDDELEGKYDEDPFIGEPEAPGGTDYWGDWLDREPGIEMQALSKAEAPFGANVSRVLKVGKKFAPKVVAKMEQMGSDAVKKMGWVAETLEDGGQAFLVKAGTWAAELGIGATVGMGMQVIGEAVGSKTAGTWLAFTGAAAAGLIDANPSFLVMTGIAYGISELTSAYAKQAARERQTDHPESGYGQRFGFVRDGKKWYPAYQAVDIDMYGGLGVDRNDVVMVYGENYGDENLHFMMDSDSKLRPTWTKWHKIKILREPRDKELVGKQSTLHGQSRDGLRDWYFLDPSEQAQLLKGGRQQTAMYKDFKTHDDNVQSYLHVQDGDRGVDSLQAYQKNLLDMKYASDLMRDYNYRFHTDYGTGLGITESARGLQRLAKWYSGDFGVDGKWKANPFGGPGLSPDIKLYEKKLGKSPAELHKKWGDLGENEWLLETTMEQLTELVHTQKTAAQEAGYPDVTTERRYPKLLPLSEAAFRDIKKSDVEKHFPELGAYVDAKMPYRAYLDLGKNLPTAQNSDELEAQLERISGMEDRTYLQQNYLAQKVYARYLMNQVAVRGGSDALTDRLYYPARIRQTVGPYSAKEPGEYHEDWGKERFHNYDDSVQAMLYWDAQEGNAYLPPWATADDDGKIMPSFMGQHMGKKNVQRLAENQQTLKLAPAEHLSLSHTNSSAPDKLYSFSPDDVHELQAQDIRLHMDWQRKNPWALANRKYGSGKVRGFFPYFKSGEAKKKRLAQIAKQWNAYHGQNILVHNPYDKEDSYFQGGWRWSTDHYVKDGAGPEQFVMNPVHGAKGPKQPPGPRDIVVDPTDRTSAGYYWKRPGYFYDPILKRYVADPAKQSDKFTFADMPEDTFGGHGNVEGRKTKFEKLPDDKGRDSKKKELEKQRYLERFKQSEAKPKPPPKKRDTTERINQMLLERQRHAHGMSKEQWDQYLKHHGGKTPDQVIKELKEHEKPDTSEKPPDYDKYIASGTGLGYWQWKAKRKAKHQPPVVIKDKDPLPPPKHVITPWTQPVHDHVIHGPLPGSRHAPVMHHAPEARLFEDSAPSHIPLTVGNHTSSAPTNVPPSK